MDELIKRRFMELKAGGLLPSPKGIALAVIELTNQPNTSFQDITRMVKADPAISGRILRYANAAHGGSLRHIVSLGQAITFLGMSRVRQIVLGFSLIDEYRNGPCPAFDYVGYWKSALAAGIAAQRLAHLARAPADESYTCGLLAGIGRLGFATAFPADYAEILASGLSGRDLNTEERNRFGLEHAQLSAEMLDCWGLPAVFTDAVRNHELSESASLDPGSRAYILSVALGLATRIGRLFSLDEAQRWQLFPAIFSAAALLDMAEEDAKSLIKAVADDWQSWAADLKLPARVDPDLSNLLSEAPAGLCENIKSAMDAVPLRFVIFASDGDRSSRLAGLLEGLGYEGIRVSGMGEYPPPSLAVPMDVAIVDTGEYDRNLIGQLRAMQTATGRSMHVIALCPDAAKSGVSLLLQEGADDYLLYGYTETAFQLRVLNAQHRVAFQAAMLATIEPKGVADKDLGRSGSLPSHEATQNLLASLPGQRDGLDLAARQWSAATGDASRFAGLVLSVDHFGRVCEQYGRDVGDMVLRQVAAIVVRCCRAGDSVFRYGEHGFCIVCSNSNEPKARQLADRIAAAVRTHAFALPSGTLQVTLRIGIAVRSPAMTSPEAMIAEAAKSLDSKG